MVLCADADPVWKGVPGPASYLHKLAVDRAFAGRGHGLELLRACEETSRDWQLAKIRLDCVASNARMCRYYEDAGYLQRGFARGGGVEL